LTRAVGVKTGLTLLRNCDNMCLLKSEIDKWSTKAAWNRP